MARTFHHMRDDTWHTDDPMCPHCLYVERDAVEWLENNCEDGETECSSCGKAFRWSVHHSRSWTTKPVSPSGTVTRNAERA